MKTKADLMAQFKRNRRPADHTCIACDAFFASSLGLAEHNAVCERRKEILKGTPKTLIEALQNANESVAGTPDKWEPIFEQHVRDFLSQKFTIAMYEAEDTNEEIRIAKLWKSITGKDMEVKS